MMVTDVFSLVYFNVNPSYIESVVRQTKIIVLLARKVEDAKVVMRSHQSKIPKW